MKKKIISNNNEFPRFLNQLAKDLSKFYYNKLSKKFKVQNAQKLLCRCSKNALNNAQTEMLSMFGAFLGDSCCISISVFLSYLSQGKPPYKSNTILQ